MCEFNQSINRADSVLFSVFGFGISVMLSCILSLERWSRVFILLRVEGIAGSPNPGERAGIGQPHVAWATGL